MAKKKKDDTLIYLGKFIWFFLKIPYYIVREVYNLIKGVSEFFKEKRVINKRKNLTSKYEEFKVIQVLSGSYENWVQKVCKSDSQIGIVLGSRGSGKTAFGIKLLENIHIKCKKKYYAMGFKAEEMPSWINVISEISKIENNSFVLVDEGGILFHSRKAMSSANKILSDLIMISRHKNLSILFISQNSSNLEVNILRQADFIVLKPSSLLQKEFERKIIQKFYEETEKSFEKFKDIRGLAYIYSNNFKGFISNILPSFWKESISKSFK